MKKEYLFVVQIVTCVLLVICMFKISSLNNQIQNLKNHLSSRISDVEHEVGNISYDISKAMEEEASILSLAQWEYGEIDENSKTVEMFCEITPKEYSSGTTAEMVYDDKRYPLTYDNGIYVGKIMIPLFEEVHIPLVQFAEDGSVRTEYLEWYLSPRSEVLPYVYAEAPESCSYGRESNATEVSFTYTGNIFLHCGSEDDLDKIQESYVVECIDGKEISRIKFANETMCEWNKETSIPFNSTYEVYVETIDIYNFHHRNIVFYAEISDSGDVLDNHGWYYGAEANIYDDKGNPLYVTDSLY